MHKDTLIKVSVIGGVALLAILMMHQRANKNSPAVDALGISPTNAGFENPYYLNTPGENTFILNGGPPFVSAVNVDVHPELLGYLSNKYIPMFGFVGITAGYTQTIHNVAAPVAVQQMSFAGYTPPPLAASATRMSFGATMNPFPTYH